MATKIGRWARRQAKKDPVGGCISKSMSKGKPQDQAIAIALEEKREGKLAKKSKKAKRKAGY